MPRFTKSLRLRLFLMLCLIGLVPCSVMKNVIIASFETRAVESRKNELLQQMQVLSASLVSEGGAQLTVSETARKEIEMLAEFYDGRVLVLDRKLSVLADSEQRREGKTVISAQAMRALRNGESGASAGYLKEEESIELAVPVGGRSGTAESQAGQAGGAETVRGVLLASVSAATITTTLVRLNAIASRIQWIFMLCIIVLAAVAAELISRPFDRITRAIHEVKLGYTNEPITVPDFLETEQITDAFNSLQARMQVLDNSRQEFVSNVSHELRTPITSMKVLADSLLETGEVPPETYREFLSDISDEIDREDRIINDLLTLVRLDKSATEVNIRQVNINEMTEIVLKRLRPIARARNIELILESERQVTAQVDEVKLSLAIMNIVENAIKYNNDGGRVRVELDADHRSFTLKISDTGIGMPEEVLPHIFERFYRVDKSRSREIGGTGLGLSFARQAVIMHRGEIDVESTEGVGTVFTLRIPLFFAAQEASAEKEADKKKAPGFGRWWSR